MGKKKFIYIYIIKKKIRKMNKIIIILYLNIVKQNVLIN